MVGADGLQPQRTTQQPFEKAIVHESLESRNDDSGRSASHHGQHTDLPRAVPEQAQRLRPLGSGAHRAVPHPRDQDCSGTSPAATASSLSDAINAARRRRRDPLDHPGDLTPAYGSDRSDQIQSLAGDVDRDLTTIRGIHTAGHESLAHQSIAQPSDGRRRHLEFDREVGRSLWTAAGQHNQRPILRQRHITRGRGQRPSRDRHERPRRVHHRIRQLVRIGTTVHTTTIAYCNGDS